MIVTEDTPTDEQQKNWIKDEWLGWKGVQMWEKLLGWGGGMGGGKFNELYNSYLGQFPRKLPHGYIIKCYKNASRVNRYNFPTVKAIDLLFSTLHTTPFHYGETYFGALH